jgi:hypothetical protein
MRLPFFRQRPILGPEFFSWGVCPFCGGAISPEGADWVYCPSCGRIWERE